MSIRTLLCTFLIGLAGISGVAVAQQSATAPKSSAATQPPARQLTAQQRAAIEKQNQVLVKYAESIASMIDNGQIGQVWDQSSEVMKKAVPQDKFISATKTDRASMGTVTSRKVAEVTRSLSKGGKLPAGYYVNVNFATTFSKHTKPVRELVSFHLDSDKKWRVSGYTLH